MLATKNASGLHSVMKITLLPFVPTTDSDVNGITVEYDASTTLFVSFPLLARQKHVVVINKHGFILPWHMPCAVLGSVMQLEDESFDCLFEGRGRAERDPSTNIRLFYFDQRNMLEYRTAGSCLVTLSRVHRLFLPAYSETLLRLCDVDSAPAQNEGNKYIIWHRASNTITASDTTISLQHWLRSFDVVDEDFFEMKVVKGDDRCLLLQAIDDASVFMIVRKSAETACKRPVEARATMPSTPVRPGLRKKTDKRSPNDILCAGLTKPRKNRSTRLVTNDL